MGELGESLAELRQETGLSEEELVEELVSEVPDDEVPETPDNHDHPRDGREGG